MSELRKGDYVLATKWQDGDPQDDWGVGIYVGPTKHNPPRHDVSDNEGQLFRGNGFGRVKKISPELGKWLLDNAGWIERSARSIWAYARMGRVKREELAKGVRV